MLTRRELAIFCLAFLLSLPLVTTRLYASDEIEHFAWLRSIAFDRDVDFDNEYRYFVDAGVARDPGFHETFLQRVNEAGKRINYAPVGAAILWAPFYAVGHLVAGLTGAPSDGLSQPYIASVAYGSAFYGFAAVLLSAIIARRVLGHGGHALATSVIIAFGTPLVFYTYVAPGFGHAASAFCVALFLWCWLRARESWSPRDALWLGLSGGLMATVREQDVLLVIGPGLDFLIYAARAIRRSTTPASRVLVTAATGIVAFLAGVAPQLAAYKALNGHIGQTTTAANKMTWTSPHGVSVLFSPHHGFFAWTPLALLALGGLIWLALRRPAPDQDARLATGARTVAALALLMVAAQAYTSGVVESWTVAGSFGQRRFIALTPLLVVGIASLWFAVKTTAARRLVAVALGVCVWWNVGLMAQFGLHRMNRQTLTLAENARVSFVELPLELPGIAWRYLTDRSSFYRKPRS